MTGPAVLGGKAAGSRAELERNSDASPLVLEDGRGGTQRLEVLSSLAGAFRHFQHRCALSLLGSGPAAGPGRAEQALPAA